MKKLFSFVLTAVLMMSLLITPASAAEEARVSGSQETANAGSEVTVAFSIEEATFASYEMQIVNYDTDVLTLIGISQGEASKGYFDYNDSLNGKVAGANSQDSTVSGALFYATFKVADDAQPGTYNVGISVDYVANIATDDLTISASAGSVTIECNHKWGEWIVDKEATCVDEGAKHRICEKCGEREDVIIPATGEHTYDEGKVTKAPNCTDKGIKTYTCSVCGHTYTEELNALGHKWDEGKVTTKPTCTEDGVMTFTCTVCGETYTEVIEAHGHDWGPWTVVKEPTVDEWGLEERVCKICGCKETRDIEPAKDQVPETGVRSNNYGAWIAVAAVAGVAVTFVWKRKTAK